MCICNSGYAQIRFHFVESEVDEVVAQLQLAALPAQFDDLVELEFTDFGQEVFGLGDIYQGTFDMMIFDHGEFIYDGRGGLGAIDKFGGEFVTMADSDPPGSAVADDTRMFYLSTSSLDQQDTIRLLLSPRGEEISLRGDWVAVPEPTSYALSWLIVCLGPTIVGTRSSNRARERRAF